MLTASPPAHWVVPYTLWRTDERAIRGLQAAQHRHAAGGMVDSLVVNGHALVVDWQLDIGALRMQAFALLAARSARRVVQKATPVSWRELPALLPMLANDSALAAAVRTYLGGPVRFDGAQVLRLSNELVTASQYVSGNWHHDRCGRRLKAF
eukprot:4136568-Prymnesium_polylepis.1